MPPARRTSLIVAVLILLAGCSGDQDPGLKPDPSVPLASYATEGLSIARADFCDLIEPEAVERALGGETATTNHYGNGDSVEVSPGVTDIAHEYNCTFSTTDGIVARGWVFAPPMTTDRADQLVRRSLKAEGCTPITGAAAFGNPTVATMCQNSGSTTATFRGLFVDAWLNCSVSMPTGTVEGLVDTADRWCAAVAMAAHQQFGG